MFISLKLDNRCIRSKKIALDMYICTYLHVKHVNRQIFSKKCILFHVLPLFFDSAM